MGIEEIVTRLAGLQHSVVGRGPRHPTHPDPSVEADVRSFLDAHPALRDDPCYSAFLEQYGGAAVESPDGTVIVNVLGFSDVSLHMLEVDAPVVKDGLLVFAICVYHSFDGGTVTTHEHDFAFEVSGSREPGVYRYYSTFPDSGQSVSWYTSDFCAWLNDFIDRGGVYEPLAAEGGER